MAVVDEHIQKWTLWVEGPIGNDIIGMHHHRHIWREVGEILDGNPQLANTPSAFWDWMRDLYATSQAVGIRRQADRDPRACSLARLIEEMRDDAPRLTRAYFLSLWAGHSELWFTQRAEEAFDRLGGVGGGHLDPAIPTAD